MTEPDELYTLRAQYWLGHYQSAIDEARSVSRRPMSPALKLEREEFLARSYLALGQPDKVTNQESPGTSLQALVIKAGFEAAAGNEAAQASLCDRIKSLAGGNSGDANAQLYASQMLLSAGQTKEALQLVHHGSTLEQTLQMLQIYLKLDRLDLAKQALHSLSSKDEDSILAQLGSVYVNLASGSTGAADAIHSLNSLSEQYGPSPLLLNLMACALLQQGDYAAAEERLQECLRDHGDVVSLRPETLVNLIAASVHQQKPVDAYVSQMQSEYPTHAFCAGLQRVTSAFEREAVKYKV